MSNFFWRPWLIVFISNTCIMVIELVAGRILAPMIGVSLYTWTSIIGVILAGISLGNYLGGRLADQAASRLMLGRIFFGSSLATLSILATALFAHRIPFILSTPIYVLLVTSAIFFLPGVVLGMVSPIVIKLALNDLEKSGSTVGTIYAFATLGNIVGTFATGFVLISLLGTRLILLLVALLLLLTGVAVLDWTVLSGKERRGSHLLAGSLFIAILVSLLTGYADSRCGQALAYQETNYFCIRIIEETRGDREVQLLVLDRLIHTTINPDNPEEIGDAYGYEAIFATILEREYPRDGNQPLNTLTIGGGGYSFPRYLQAVYDAGVIDVIEIDPAVTKLAEERFGVVADMRIRSINNDARMAIRTMPKVPTYDVIMGDAFNDFSVPYHLTTVEFNEDVASLLEEDGLYLINTIDGRSGNFIRSMILTLRDTFSHVYLIPTEPDWRSSLRTTFVVVASRRPVPLEALNVEGAEAGADEVLSDEVLEAFMAAGQPVLLRDGYVPTDNLLAPVFADAFN